MIEGITKDWKYPSKMYHSAQMGAPIVRNTKVENEIERSLRSFYSTGGDYLNINLKKDGTKSKVSFGGRSIKSKPSKTTSTTKRTVVKDVNNNPICWDWNDSGCSRSSCKFAHSCMVLALKERW